MLVWINHLSPFFPQKTLSQAGLFSHMTIVSEDFLLNGQWSQKVFSPMVSPMVTAIQELLPNGQPNGHGHLENFPNGQWSRPFRIDHMERLGVNCTSISGTMWEGGDIPQAINCLGVRRPVSGVYTALMCYDGNKLLQYLVSPTLTPGISDPCVDLWNRKIFLPRKNLL